MEDSVPLLPRDTNPLVFASCVITVRSACEDALDKEPGLCRVGDATWFRSMLCFSKLVNESLEPLTLRVAYLSKVASSGSDGAEEYPAGTGEGAACAAAAAFTAASLAAFGTCLHASTKCAATSG